MPITNIESTKAIFVTKTVTFTGASGLGAKDVAVPVFTVTGEILVAALVPFCTVNCDVAVALGTVALGVTGSTALFSAATLSVDIDANEFWFDITPYANGIALPAAFKDIVITDNIIVTPATQNTNAGSIRFDLYYLPLSSGSTVVAS